MPCTVYAAGQATLLDAERTPELSSAAAVITFIVEPGATWAVSAKSLKPALLAIARILPVDGWMTTIELPLCMWTALRAAASACALIVVASDGMFCGGTTTAWLLGTALPAAVWISTYRPGLPCPGGACFPSRFAMLVSPASLYEARSFPLASVTETTWGATVTAARCVVAVRFGARTSGFQPMYHTFEFGCW